MPIDGDVGAVSDPLLSLLHCMLGAWIQSAYIGHYDISTERKKAKGENETHMPTEPGSHLRDFPESHALSCLFMSPDPKEHHIVMLN